MSRRFARAYVRFLFGLEIFLFSASLALHLSVLAGAEGPYARYGSMLFGAAVVVGVSVTSFIKDSLTWVAQIKACPKWMWRTALLLGGYGIFLGLMMMIFPQGPSVSDQTLMWSGVPLPFEAISLCVLFSVLWRRYLAESEIVRRALYSVIAVALIFSGTVAYRAGYLRHPSGY